MTGNPRVMAVVLEVTDLDRSAELYREAFGLDLRFDDHEGGDHGVGDRWTSGRHAVAHWGDGAPLYFALYQARHAPTVGAQVALAVEDLPSSHRRALLAGACVLHGPRTEPWGWSARYRDPDGNVVELTQHLAPEE